MVTISDLQKMTNKVDFWNGQDLHSDETKAWGYDEHGELLFSAKYDENDNFQISLFSKKSGDLRICEDLSSEDLNDPTLSPNRKEKINQAKSFINKLKADKLNNNNTKNYSFAELLEKGISVNLSEQSRLSFAPDIEKLHISKDKDGTLLITGMSKDGKSRIDFSHKNGVMSFELHDKEIARSYTNKIGGKFTYRDLQSPTQTRYLDGGGEDYAKELAGIMDKVKTQYNTRQQSNTHFTDKAFDKGGR